MKRLLERLTKDWNGFRIFRALLGIGVGVYAVVSGDSFLLVLAVFVLIQALLNAHAAAEEAAAAMWRARKNCIKTK